MLISFAIGFVIISSYSCHGGPLSACIAWSCTQSRAGFTEWGRHSWGGAHVRTSCENWRPLLLEHMRLRAANQNNNEPLPVGDWAAPCWCVAWGPGPLGPSTSGSDVNAGDLNAKWGRLDHAVRRLCRRS